MTITTPAEAGNPGVFGVTVAVHSPLGAPLGTSPSPPKPGSLDMNNPDDRAIKLANDMALIMAIKDAGGTPGPGASKAEEDMDKVAAFLLLLLMRQKQREAEAAAAAAGGTPPPTAPSADSRKAPPGLFENLRRELEAAEKAVREGEDAERNAKSAAEQSGARDKARAAKEKANEIRNRIDKANSMYDD